MKKSIYMVIGGNKVNETMQVSCFVTEQAASLQKAGLDVCWGIVDDRTSLHGIMRNIQRLRRAINQQSPAIVHAQYGSMIAFIASLAAVNVPLVISFGGTDLLGIPAPGWHWRARGYVGKLLGLWAAFKADRILVKSRNLFEALPKKLQKNAMIFPNGVDIQFFNILDKSACRAQLGWDQNSKIILFNSSEGESRWIKNPSLAQSAVKRCAEQEPRARLFMMSKASRDEVRLMMNASDCLLVTSLHEGSVNIVKEAMACNLPVVSVPCGDVEERLHGVSPGGIYAYDENALAEGLQRVFEANTRSNGRDELIKQGLAASDVANRLIQIYQRVRPLNVERNTLK